MKIHQCLFAILLAFAALVAASNSTEFPQCAVSCLAQESSSCSIYDASCVCTGAASKSALVSCAESSCTAKDYYITRHLYELECGLPIKKGPLLVDPATLAPAILATIFFFIRIAAKLGNLAGGWGPDDYTVTAAFILGVALFVVNTYMIKYGFGMNSWDILPFHHITLVFQYFEGLAMMYKIQISLCKISVLLFLLRIFQSRVFRVLAYILIGVNAAIGITFSLVDLLRCTPVHLDWDGWTGENIEEGTCINFIAAVMVHCLVNIFVDVVIVILPIYEVTKLQLPFTKKVTVAFMFMMGLILTIVAIIRVVVFWEHRWTNNLTAGLQPLIHWSVIESQIAIMTTCLPAARAFITHYFPALGGSSARRTYARTNSLYNNTPSGANSKISKSVNISVDYTTRSARDSTSAVHLVEMDGRYERF
ncbi:CFEM domain-containing protein [Aspergillus ibericus CBS 121593]|uniref:Integral membrane protein n=1 Tax=Aspergillus ibericus CBS 121593 TaxID=1448316 RepID=A0A395H5Y1_9EURO|nr:integral membrane protein [Aspergillus ibericus CBS 121593]RAL03302.1 integral membrane protein [Aspergillus ibericus CBS 121593]